MFQANKFIFYHKFDEIYLLLREGTFIAVNPLELSFISWILYLKVGEEIEVMFGEKKGGVYSLLLFFVKSIRQFTQILEAKTIIKFWILRGFS